MHRVALDSYWFTFTLQCAPFWLDLIFIPLFLWANAGSIHLTYPFLVLHNSSILKWVIGIEFILFDSMQCTMVSAHKNNFLHWRCYFKTCHNVMSKMTVYRKTGAKFALIDFFINYSFFFILVYLEWLFYPFHETVE